MSQLRTDLQNRIKERHDQWFFDALNLYQMGKLKPHQCANDVVEVLTFNIIWLLDHYGVDLDEYIKGLKHLQVLYRDEAEK